MRLRKIGGALERLEADTKYYVINPEKNKGGWNKVFKNNNPICVEIGCGKGDFVIGMAQAFPEVNFIAVEKFESVQIRALEKALELDLPNVRMIHEDAINLTNIFDKDEISNIYLNFSDPWPKNRHAKRRLTSSLFLECYKKFLKEDGAIIQKTDNTILFEYSIESLSNDGWYLSDISVDLHKKEIFNVLTEYERKKSKLGPIYKLEARRIKKTEE